MQRERVIRTHRVILITTNILQLESNAKKAQKTNKLSEKI